jgi:hypothetical protein
MSWRAIKDYFAKRGFRVNSMDLDTNLGLFLDVEKEYPVPSGPVWISDERDIRQFEAVKRMKLAQSFSFSKEWIADSKDLPRLLDECMDRMDRQAKLRIDGVCDGLFMLKSRYGPSYPIQFNQVRVIKICDDPLVNFAPFAIVIMNTDEYLWIRTTAEELGRLIRNRNHFAIATATADDIKKAHAHI